MHLRPESDPRTLADVAADWKSHDRSWNSDACVPEVDFNKEIGVEPTISLGDHKISLDEEATDRLCSFYEIPRAFFNRLTRAEQHFVMNSRIDHADGEVTVEYNRRGITDVRKPTQPRLEVEQFVRIAHRIFPPNATVLDDWFTADDLRLDVINPLPNVEDEDLVYGGLRFAQNRKSNLAPTVSPILFHLDTTTVIEVPDASLKIDARKVSIEKIAERLEAEALRADARTTKDAEHLLNLQRVSIGGDRITRLHRVAAEYNLPVRPLADVTVSLSRTDEPTMLDLVLAIANAANSPKLQDASKRTARTKLQSIAGAVLTDESARCASCAAVLAA
ncbi:hypothetical protein OG497_38115 [Streptomyces sp. NBC_01242]|uniref:hypothetical protein n=1 Tax=Streptomyces sp. NBC_01242 TaxID=2903795 RepID=UPI002257836E|nr:hypothetical protein [Streptomyces sp. NBC_01242]MCX4799676.1 hypothetical protein [Streptomyces sp. NBC_01242]